MKYYISKRHQKNNEPNKAHNVLERYGYRLPVGLCSLVQVRISLFGDCVEPDKFCKYNLPEISAVIFV